MISVEDLIAFAETIVQVAEEYAGDLRVVLPTFKTLEFLLTNGCFEELLELPE